MSEDDTSGTSGRIATKYRFLTGRISPQYLLETSMQSCLEEDGVITSAGMSADSV
jgi:hypothetical protein